MAETETIQKFDVNDAANKLKGKIRDAFMELLTDEQFKDMVLTELKAFTQGGTKRDGYSNNVTSVPSEFSSTCREVFREQVREELKKLLASPEYATYWGAEGRQVMSEAVMSWCTEHRRELIESTILTFAGTAAQSFLENLRNNMPLRF